MRRESWGKEREDSGDVLVGAGLAGGGIPSLWEVR